MVNSMDYVLKGSGGGFHIGADVKPNRRMSNRCVIATETIEVKD